MNFESLTNILTAWMPSIVGSAGALLWMQGSPKRLLVLWVIGAFCGVYVGGYVVHVFELPDDVSSFVVGLFGMSIADKLFKALREFDFGEVLMGFLRRFLK